MEEKYLKKINEMQKILNVLNTQVSKYSILRLVNFLLIIIFLILTIVNYNLFYMLTFILFIITFIFLVIIHNKQKKNQNFTSNFISVLNEYLSRINGDWINFKEKGQQFYDTAEYFMLDLDIVGEQSLFQLLNIAKTEGGKNKLYKKLSNNKLSEKELLSVQESIKELTEKEEFALSFQAYNKSNDLLSSNLEESLKLFSKKIEFNKIHLLIGITLSIITWILLILGLSKIISIYYFWGIFFVQLIQSFIYKFLWNESFENISKCTRSFYSLKNPFLIIDNNSFASKILITLRENIQKGTIGINMLSFVNSLSSINSNFLTSFMFNVFFSLNIFIIYFYNNAQAKYYNEIENAINSLEEFEALISLSILGNIKENVSFPKLSENIEIDFENLMHPLLLENKNVPNSFSTNAEINIITGSNMSGKTSFLRTIGINIVLMNAGCMVSSNKFNACYLKIITSMRIKDNIVDGISTFYAEILRLKEAIEYQKNKQPMLVLVDEIFKGTNPNDRITGAKSIINKLNKDNVILFITTHDFELCDMDNINNYHFEETYIKDKINFDYKIKKGKCKTTNAIYLMKQADIL